MSNGKRRDTRTSSLDLMGHSRMPAAEAPGPACFPPSLNPELFSKFCKYPQILPQSCLFFFYLKKCGVNMKETKNGFSNKAANISHKALCTDLALRFLASRADRENWAISRRGH